MATINGNNFNNTINGTSGDDTINGLGGNDRLYGRGGQDTIHGGTGDDLIDGDDGNDTLFGDDGDDTIYGDSGNDVMSGGAGDDDMSGGIGNDTASGGDGNDKINGDDGNDVLTGGAGQDQISGGGGDDNVSGDDGDDVVSGDDGNDVVKGGAGNDLLSGGDGNDNLTGGGGLDFIDGGAGIDTAVYSGSVFEYSFSHIGPLATVIHNGPGGPGSGADGADLLVWVERLQFSDFTVDLTANNAPVAFDDQVSINEDSVAYSSGTASVLDNDHDFDGDPLTVTPGVFVGTYGTLTLNANGTYNYVLNANAQTLAQGQVAQDSFTYTVSDGSATDTGQLVFNITGNNDAPVANPDSAGTTENAVVLVNVLANDTDVDNGAVLTVTAASAPPGQGSASVVGNQVRFDPGTDFDHLAAGATQLVTVNYTMKDQFGATSSSTVTITVTGTNDGPVANPDTATTTENAVVLVNVLANDTDVDDGAVLTVTSAAAPPGQGSASVVGNQVRFDPGSDFDHLAVGATQVVNVSYSIQDQFGATSSSTIAVTVTGTNDGPVAHPDTATTSENAVLLVNVLANDTDPDDGAVLTVTSATAPPGQGSASVVGNQVQFNPGSDFDHLAAGATQVVNVSYSIQDQFGATSSSTIAITVTGTNDGPVANPDSAGTSENASVLINVLANDTDVDDGAVLTVTAASAPAGQGSASVVSNQVQFNPGSDFDHLAVGETATVTVNYSIQDEHGASSSSTVTITVTGTNDAPTIDAGNTDASGSVTELPNNDPNENNFTHTDSGTIAFDDVDVSDTHSASFAPQGGGYVGSFTLDPVNQAGDTVAWHYSVQDSDIDFLDAGQTLTQTYTVTISDGHGGTTTQNVTITINGASDNVPPDGTNWYIDNSAVGSLNNGSPTDPFTSIAAFNAAQGTPGGPGINDNVFLLAGTGTYAEADGINLLDGQTLTGVASGPLRPTIVATAGDGINVAQNNNIAGLDIGSTSGAGIADSGGSVGTLTIADVAKGGTGQIADIDQGGTINVTLNSATSLGSSGGAIDLQGLGGSFTVAGATTITGAQTGGGINIAGGSVSATFGGGGLVSTGSANGVSFTGSSGTLTLANNFDIVTTTGAGLTATGGGTLVVTGSGNSIVSAGGTALTVMNTAIGAADATFESVSANGGSYGIRLVNTGAAGGLHITGIGNVDGSGGTIQNIGLRGIELVGTSDVSIANVVLNNANTIDGVSTDLNVSGSNAAIYMSAVTGASFANVDINGAADSGIVGVNVSDFALSDSTITLAGNAPNESGIEFTNLSGNSSVTNTDISFSETNSLDIVNTDVSLNLVLDNVTMRDTQTVSSGGPVNGNGEGGFQFRSFSVLAGAPVTNIDIIDSDFLRLRTQGIQIIAEDDSAVSADITNNVIDSQADIGAGIDLGTADIAQMDFNVIGNTIQSRGADAVNVSVSQGSDVEGRINDNVMTDNSIGSGIRIVVQDLGSTGIIEARNNSITQVTGNNSASIDATARNGDARLDLTLDNNSLDSNTGALADINITAGASAANETASVYLDLTNNHVVAGGPTNLLRLRTADLNATSDPRIFLTGFVEGGAGLDDDAVATWNARGNTPTATPANINVTQTAGATAPSAGTAQVPTNPQPLMADGISDHGPVGHALGQGELDAIVGAAVQRWADAGATADQLAAMRATGFSVASLAGLDLGLATSHAVLIDDDGAGHGWFVDATPADDSEFASGSGPAGMDLLSVVMHELGHAAGLGDDYSGGAGAMQGYLGEGERHLPVFDTGGAPSGTGDASLLLADLPMHHAEMML